MGAKVVGPRVLRGPMGAVVRFLGRLARYGEAPAEREAELDEMDELCAEFVAAGRMTTAGACRWRLCGALQMIAHRVVDSRGEDSTVLPGAARLAGVALTTTLLGFAGFDSGATWVNLTSPWRAALFNLSLVGSAVGTVVFIAALFSSARRLRPGRLARAGLLLALSLGAQMLLSSQKTTLDRAYVVAMAIMVFACLLLAVGPVEPRAVPAALRINGLASAFIGAINILFLIDTQGPVSLVLAATVFTSWGALEGTWRLARIPVETRGGAPA